MNFNSRPSARGDFICKKSRKKCDYFNSRPSARGDARHPDSAVHPPHFNSRPSARGDVGKVLSGVQSIISIHAPPRGATSTPRSFLRFAYYFNSRPSARGDTRHPDSSVHPPYFNSRPSARGDCGAKFEKIQFRSISIHAPPRGATESCR